MNQNNRQQRIYAVLTVTSPGETLARLNDMLDSPEIAAILIAPPDEKPLNTAAVQPLVAKARDRGMTVLIASDPILARDTGASGVHVSWSKDIAVSYARARDIAGPDAIVGADAGRSRHDAMTLGEKGADYIAFGIPPHVEDRATAHERQMELLSWWSGIFEIPCVAFDLASPQDAAAALHAGADFITWTPGANTDPGDTGQTLAAFMAALSDSEQETV